MSAAPSLVAAPEGASHRVSRVVEPDQHSRQVRRKSLLRTSILAHDLRWVALAATMVSVVATVISYQRGWILAYGDAESHVNIAKRVVSGVQPGFAQLGGVWLPLHHVLMLPFVWNDALWRTGLAGSVVSMAAYVGSTLYLYRLVSDLSGSRGKGLLAAAFLGLNAGILYIQTTPMSEMLLILTLLASVYHFSVWLGTSSTVQLTLTALFAAAGTLVRYDGWALVLAQAAAIVLVALVRRWQYSRLEGTVVLFSSLAFVGIAGWVGWNLIIFHQPTYFFRSQYSAHAQQQAFKIRGELPAYHHFGTTLRYYGDAVWRNTGTMVTVLASVGLVIWLLRCLRGRVMLRALVPVALLLVPVAFNAGSLWAGVSIVFLPDVTPSSFQWHLFNARYGLMAVPFMATLAALGLPRFPIARAIVVVIFVATSLASAPISLQDGLVGLSRRGVSPASAYVAAHYDGSMIVFDDFSHPANPIALGAPMDHIIYIGYRTAYAQAVTKPSSIVHWIIVNRANSDAYWMAVKDNPDFLQNFRLVFSQGDAGVYRLISGQVTP
jgi:hypothetical protein